MHGGAKGSGAPNGNQNALKTGCHTKEVRERKRELSALASSARRALREVRHRPIEARD